MGGLVGVWPRSGGGDEDGPERDGRRGDTVWCVDKHLPIDLTAYPVGVLPVSA